MRGMLRIIMLLHCAMLFGCASQIKPIGDYQAVARQFNDSLKAARPIADHQISAVPNTMRMLAVRCRMRAGQGCQSTNVFQPGGERAGFARMACAGTATAQIYAELAYLGTFGTSLDEVMTKPDDNLVAVVKHIRDLRQRDKLLAIPDPELGAKAFAACVDDVVQIMQSNAWNGRDDLVERRAAPEEAVELLALVEAVKILISTVEKAATALAKVADEAAQKAAFRDIVLLNAEGMRTRLSADGSIATELEGIWQRRKIASLLGPYETYGEIEQAMVRVPRNDTSIYSLTARLNKEFGDFDILRTSPNPKVVLKALDGAYAKLQEVADGKATPKQALDYLTALVKQLREVAARTAEAKNAFDALGSTN